MHDSTQLKHHKEKRRKSPICSQTQKFDILSSVWSLRCKRGKGESFYPSQSWIRYLNSPCCCCIGDKSIHRNPICMKKEYANFRIPVFLKERYGCKKNKSLLSWQLVVVKPDATQIQVNENSQHPKYILD